MKDRFDKKRNGADWKGMGMVQTAQKGKGSEGNRIERIRNRIERI